MANTEVAFHFNVPNKVAYTCKLLRKATLAGARLAVLAPPDLLARLDAELWAFSPQDFVAHVRMPCTAQAQERSPVLLCDEAAPTDAAQAAGYSILVNLGTQVPAGFEGFARLIEIVSQDDADRQAARARWKHYEAGGVAIVRHDVAQSA
jgi:DNA polymerase III subunit chi